MNTKRIKAFTLIELLTVIVIISILIALLFPAIKSALLKAEVNQAKSDVVVIQSGVKMFYAEYGRYPNTSSSVANYNYGSLSGDTSPNSTLMGALLGLSSAIVLNPKQMVFLSVPSRKTAIDSGGNFIDPWGHAYEISIDTWGNSTCSNVNSTAYSVPPQTAPIPQAVCVWSLGPDGISSNNSNSDDVVSWQ